MRWRTVKGERSESRSERQPLDGLEAHSIMEAGKPVSIILTPAFLEAVLFLCCSHAAGRARLESGNRKLREVV